MTRMAVVSAPCMRGIARSRRPPTVSAEASLVVIELKRTEDGGHMELQAIRYAAMISAMSFSKAVDVYGRYLERNNSKDDAEAALLQFLNWDIANEETFGQDVRIVLVSSESSK